MSHVSRTKRRFALLALPGGELARQVNEYRHAAARLAPNRALEFEPHCTIIPPMWAAISSPALHHAFWQAAQKTTPLLDERHVLAVCFGYSKERHEITLAAADVRKLVRDFSLRLEARLGTRLKVRNRFHLTLAHRLPTGANQALRTLGKDMIFPRSQAQWRLTLVECLEPPEVVDLAPIHNARQEALNSPP